MRPLELQQHMHEHAPLTFHVLRQMYKVDKWTGSGPPWGACCWLPSTLLAWQVQALIGVLCCRHWSGAALCGDCL